MPVLIIQMFLRAEREGDWFLHLCCVKQMLPYTSSRQATGIMPGMDSGIFMKCKGPCPMLPRKCSWEETMFADIGKECGLWNAVFSNEFGEQTYIRYGKAKGGLVGLTLSSDQVAGWVLSYHICNMVSLSMDDMFETNYDENAGTKMKRHKEEGLEANCWWW